MSESGSQSSSSQKDPKDVFKHTLKLVSKVREAIKKGDTSTAHSRLDELERAMGGPTSESSSASSERQGETTGGPEQATTDVSKVAGEAASPSAVRR